MSLLPNHRRLPPIVWAALLWAVGGLIAPQLISAQVAEPPAPDDPQAEDPEAPEPDEPDEPPAGVDDAPRYQPSQRAPAVPETICEGRRVQAIRVRGTGRVADQDVVATLGVEVGAVCTDQEIASGVAKLWDLGYFDDIVIEGRPADGEIVLTIQVTERPAIATVTFAGNDDVDDDDLQEKVTLEENQILSVPRVREQIDKLRDLYAEKGYYLARIDYELVSLPQNFVEVRYNIREGEKVKVRRIRFRGNDAIDDGELRDFMQTGETGFFSFLTSRNVFQTDPFDEDMNRLQALYYDRGYLTAQIGPPIVELTPDRRHVDISIPIVEGPRFQIGRVRIQEVDETGAQVEPLEGRRRLRERLDVQPGEWFSRTKIAESLMDITRSYRDRGYAKVEIEPQTDLEMDRRIVHIVVVIQRGPLVHIERINIRGNDKTRDAVIRREFRIAEGDLYSQTLVERSKARATALGYFESVNVSETPGSRPDTLVVNYEVVERPTGTFQVGAGLSSIENFIFTAQIQQQNLFGRGHALSLQLQLSSIRQLAQVRFVEPYLLGSRWLLAVEGTRSLQQFIDFDRSAWGSSITLGHPILAIDDRLRFSVEYLIESVTVGTRTGRLFGGAAAFNFAAFRQLPLYNLFRDGLTSSVRFGLSWDSRNNRMMATDGVFASATSEFAHTALGSDNRFTRHRAFFRAYKPIPFFFDGLVFRLNVDWGLITAPEGNNVPIFERFFLGGIFDLRGFPMMSLGPRIGLARDTDPNAVVPRQGIVIGGNMQAYTNVEIEFPILTAVGIRGVIFTDAGNTWNLERSLCLAPGAPLQDPAFGACGVDLLALRHSWGVGIRWFSPLGPLRFELGFPFSPRTFEQSSRFDFTIGQFF